MSSELPGKQYNTTAQQQLQHNVISMDTGVKEKLKSKTLLQDGRTGCFAHVFHHKWVEETAKLTGVLYERLQL